MEFYLSQPINAREEELKANRTSPMTIYKNAKQVLLLVICAAPAEEEEIFTDCLLFDLS